MSLGFEVITVKIFKLRHGALLLLVCRMVGQSVESFLPEFIVLVLVT